MTTTALPARSRFPRWAKVVCALLALVLVPAGAAMAWLVLAFSGGLDDLLSRSVDADDARVVEAREAALPALEQDLAGLPVGGATLLARPRATSARPVSTTGRSTTTSTCTAPRGGPW